MPLPDRARTLKEAYQVCDVGPLYGDSLRFYAELDTVRRLAAVQKVNTRLDMLEAGQFTTILFTGHRGCGKSTELRKLQKNWHQDYRVVYLEVDNQIDTNDAEYTDIYLLLIKQVSDDLTKLNLKFDSDLLERFEKWFMEVVEETEETIEKSVSIEASWEIKNEIPLLSKLLAKLLAQIKGAHVHKRKIRDVLQRNVGRLQEDINKLLDDAFKKLQKKGYSKGFLVILDNLDRVSPEVGNKLYFDYAMQLQSLHCTIIYTVPISVVHSPKNLSNAFGRPNIMPMVNIYNFDVKVQDLQYNALAVSKFSEVISQRMDIGAIFDDPELVGLLVAASGGHIRQLMQLIAEACLTAMTRSHRVVMQEDITDVIIQEQFHFERTIPESHYPMLVQAYKTKRIEQNDIGQAMLFNLSVLEYEEKQQRWNYINPVVKGISAFREAF